MSNSCISWLWVYTPQGLATFEGQIVNPEIAVESEMRGTLKVHGG